jgi:hypothetical protein
MHCKRLKDYIKEFGWRKNNLTSSGSTLHLLLSRDNDDTPKQNMVYLVIEPVSVGLSSDEAITSEF